MLKYVTGNLLQDSAEALVNTVNCEGFMGKGLAYQFKLSYPATNKSYIKACKLGQLNVGTMHTFRENGKLVINFPTKNKWRSNSRMVDIETGLDALVKVIKEEKIKSIAIPPLGCGNGGLEWAEVQVLMEKKLIPLQKMTEIRIYAPGNNVINREIPAPELGLEAYILILMKKRLTRFTMDRLYASLHLVNCLGRQRLLCTKAGKTSIRALKSECKKISAFQKHFGCKDVADVLNILYNKLVSKSFLAILARQEPQLDKICAFVDDLQDETLPGVVKLSDAFAERDTINAEEMHNLLQEIELKPQLLDKLCELQLVEVNLLGYSLSRN